MEKLKNEATMREEKEHSQKPEIKKKHEEMKEHVKQKLENTEQSLRDQDRTDMEKITGTVKKTVLVMQTIFLRRLMWMKENFATALEKYGQWTEDLGIELETLRSANVQLLCTVEALSEHGDKQEASMTAKIRSLQNENLKLKQEVASLREETEETKSDKKTAENHETNDKSQELVKLIRQTETRTRRKNLVFSGIEETPHEKPSETYRKIKDVIQNNLFHGVEIDNVKRIRRVQDRRQRKILVSFRNEWQVEKIMKVKSKLRNMKGAVIYINRDLPRLYSTSTKKTDARKSMKRVCVQVTIVVLSKTTLTWKIMDQNGRENKHVRRLASIKLRDMKEKKRVKR